ncbi:MAG: dienelactone hydrolase family protein, partial [Desulfobacterales bacterium]|nr:dienelactone hydrolase family protein [Desulfobacterales bacterium]
LRKLAVLAGGAAAASSLMFLLENNYAKAAMVPENDSRIMIERIKYPGSGGQMQAYLSRPKGDGKWPAVVVVHENRGLNPHIEDVARRIAVEGFLAVAPDALSSSGGTPKDSDNARDLIGKLDGKTTQENFLAAVDYLKTHTLSTGKVGVVGFCWGGAMANQLAVNSPDLTAAVPYYGRQPDAQDVPKIKGSLLLHYGGKDERINKGIPAYEAALKAAGTDYKLYVYEGADHAFNNDTNAARYHKEAAPLAWKRTIEFLNAKLKK